MSTPGHHNDVVLVGDIREVYTDETGAISGVILLVHTDEPCEVPVMFPDARSGLSVGDRVWVRGRLTCEPMPSRPQALMFVQARWIEPMLRRGRGQGA
jgi:hypothetical protein